MKTRIRGFAYGAAPPLFIFLAFALVSPAGAYAALVLNELTPYSTNFNFLAKTDANPWVNDAPSETANGSPGWYWQNASGTATYQGGSPSPNVNGAFAPWPDGADSALANYGGPGNGGEYAAWGVVFRNNTSSTITSVTVNYWGEQWTRGALVDSLRFSYRASATIINDLVPASGATPSGWLAESGLNFQAVETGTPFFLDPVMRQQRTATLPLTVAPGEYLALRWYDADDFVGSTSSFRDATMGIDDLTVSFSDAVAAVPEASGLLFCGLAAAAVVVLRARRG
jgi:hypothetical protein